MSPLESTFPTAPPLVGELPPVPPQPVVPAVESTPMPLSPVTPPQSNPEAPSLELPNRFVLRTLARPYSFTRKFADSLISLSPIVVGDALTGGHYPLTSITAAVALGGVNSVRHRRSIHRAHNRAVATVKQERDVSEQVGERVEFVRVRVPLTGEKKAQQATITRWYPRKDEVDEDMLQRSLRRLHDSDLSAQTAGLAMPRQAADDVGIPYNKEHYIHHRVGSRELVRGARVEGGLRTKPHIDDEWVCVPWEAIDEHLEQTNHTTFYDTLVTVGQKNGANTIAAKLANLNPERPTDRLEAMTQLHRHLMHVSRTTERINPLDSSDRQAQHQRVGRDGAVHTVDTVRNVVVESRAIHEEFGVRNLQELYDKILDPTTNSDDKYRMLMVGTLYELQTGTRPLEGMSRSGDDAMAWPRTLHENLTASHPMRERFLMRTGLKLAAAALATLVLVVATKGVEKTPAENSLDSIAVFDKTEKELTETVADTLTRIMGQPPEGMTEAAQQEILENIDNKDLLERLQNMGETLSSLRGESLGRTSEVEDIKSQVTDEAIQELLQFLEANDIEVDTEALEGLEPSDALEELLRQSQRTDGRRMSEHIYDFLAVQEGQDGQFGPSSDGNYNDVFGAEAAVGRLPSWHITAAEGVEVPRYIMEANVGNYAIDQVDYNDGADGYYLTIDEPGGHWSVSSYERRFNHPVLEGDYPITLDREVRLNNSYEENGKDWNFPIPVPEGYRIAAIEFRDTETGERMETSPNTLNPEFSVLYGEFNGSKSVTVKFGSARDVRGLHAYIGYVPTAVRRTLLPPITRFQFSDGIEQVNPLTGNRYIESLERHRNPDRTPTTFLSDYWHYTPQKPGYLSNLENNDFRDLINEIKEQRSLSNHEAMVLALSADIVDRVHRAYIVQPGLTTLTPGDMRMVGSDRRGRIVDVIDDMLLPQLPPEEEKEGSDWPLEDIFKVAVAAAATIYLGKKLRGPVKRTYGYTRDELKYGKYRRAHQAVDADDGALREDFDRVQALSWSKRGAGAVPEAERVHQHDLETSLILLGRTLNENRAQLRFPVSISQQAAFSAQQFGGGSVVRQKRLENLFKIAMRLADEQQEQA